MEGFRQSNGGSAAPPYTKGPYTFSEVITFEDDVTVEGDFTCTGSFSFGDIILTGALILDNANATGLDVTGDNTVYGIDISANQTGSGYHVGGTWKLGFSDGAINIGGDSTIAFGSVADSVIVERVDITAQLNTTDKYVMGKYQTIGTSGAGTGTTIWLGDYTKLTMAHDFTDAYATRGRVAISDTVSANQTIGVMGQVEFTGAATLDATGGGYGVYGSITSSGSGTCNRNTAAGYFTMRPNEVNLDGVMACVVADMGGSGYSDYGFLANIGNNNVGEAGIGIQTTDSAVLPSAIKIFSTSGSITHAFEFTSGSTAPLTAVSGAVGNTTNKLAIDVEGTTRYIPIYDDIATS